MNGQLDRCDDVIVDRTFDDATPRAMELWGGHERDMPRLRLISGAHNKNVDPVSFLWIAIQAQNAVSQDGGLTYEMLRKNPLRYAGTPWFIMSAKILEIFEEGSESLARVEMDPGKNPIAVKWRYLTNFAAGDKVDIVGFWAGPFVYKARVGEVAIPALAAAVVMKPNAIKDMNRIVKVWRGDVGPDQLRQEPRKL